MVELISRERLNWLAGIYDGEGWFSAGFRNINHKAHKHPLLYVRVGVGNTDVYMIKEISEIYYKLGVGFHYNTRKNKSGTWTLDIVTEGMGRVKKLIAAVRPFLVTKAKQADKLMELILYRKSLGYLGGWHNEQRNSPLCEYPEIIRLIDELRALKKPQVQPSETRRKANFPLEILEN